MNELKADNNLGWERNLAIRIMEMVAEKLGDENIFDCKDGVDTKWYDFEDMITDGISDSLKNLKKD